MVLRTSLPDSSADWSCSVASLAFCWRSINEVSATPATVRAMPHGPPSRLMTLLPTALNPAVFSSALLALVPNASICSCALMPLARNIWKAVCAEARALFMRWIGSMARPMLLTIVLVLPLRLLAALWTPPSTPPRAAMTMMVCCAPAGRLAKESTRVSSPWTSLRSGPCAPSPMEIMSDSMLPERFSRSPLRLLFFAAACSAAYPLSDTALVQFLTPFSPAS